MEAVGLVPVSGARRTESEGSAQVTYGLAGAGARWQTPVIAGQTVDTSIGIGAALVHVEGTPGAGFVGKTTDTPVATPYLRIGYSVAVTPWLRVRADVAAFFAVPRPMLSFAGRDVGPWGEPLVGGALGAELVSR